MRSMAAAASRMLRKVGIINGGPRIYNADLGTYTVGYTKINTQATTAYSRTKTHKAWFVGSTDIENGTRIQDLVDGARYLVMSLKAEYINGDIAYYDGTLFYVNETCTISRISNVLDEFGRATATNFSIVDAGVWIMVNPLSFDVVEKPDRIIDKDKIKIALPGTVDIKDQDRITTSKGEKFKVVAFSRSEVEGIVMAYVETDVR